MSKAIEQELMSAMVGCLAPAPADGTEKYQRQSVSVLKRLERVLEENEERVLYLSEICARIGVSERTLRLHCAEHFGMSPHRYLWLRRINLARRALTVATAEARTVTEIAIEHGFWELGRFSVAYRQQFGETPSQTWRREYDGGRQVHEHPLGRTGQHAPSFTARSPAKTSTQPELHFAARHSPAQR